jgi:hypothetical protein
MIDAPNFDLKCPVLSGTPNSVSMDAASLLIDLAKLTL